MSNGIIRCEPGAGVSLSKPTGFLGFTDPDGLAVVVRASDVVAVEELPARTTIAGDPLAERTRICLPSHVLVVAAPAIDVLLQLRSALEPNQ